MTLVAGTTLRRAEVVAAIHTLIVMLLFVSPAFARSPSRDLIENLEGAGTIVVGSIESVTPLEHGAYLARLDVERTLKRGADHGTEVAAVEQAAVDVVWEEPALSLPARFAAREYVLLALEPLPSASIWRTRLPDDAFRAQVLAIAAAGDAFLVRPSSFDLDTLEHYLALSKNARVGDAGIVRLAALTGGGSPALARAAWQRLEGVLASRTRAMPMQAAAALVDALVRSNTGDLPDEIVEWIAAKRPDELRAPLSARMSARMSARPADDAPEVMPVAWLAAAAALDGRLERGPAIDLAASDDEARRRLAARHAGRDVAARLLPGMIRDDPAPSVRAAALARWVSLEGELAMPEARRALGDPSAQVRKQAAESLAALGEPAIEPLVYETLHGPHEAARTAIVALAMIGDSARPDLFIIAETHDDEAIRTLARVALGLPIGHRHE